MIPARYRISLSPPPGRGFTLPLELPVPDVTASRHRDGPVVRWVEEALGRSLPEAEDSPASLAPTLVTSGGRLVALDLSGDEGWALWWRLLAHDGLRQVAALHAGLFDYLQAGELEAARVTACTLVDRLLRDAA